MIEIPHKDYFEGILQLRECSKKIVDWVRQKVQRDKRALIIKEKKVRGGIDLYLSSQRYLRSLGKKLSETYSGELKQSRTLHTVSKKTGKPLYRVTIMFRSLPFKKGDKIRYRAEDYQILDIKNQVQLKNIKTGKKSFEKIEEIKKAKKL